MMKSYTLNNWDGNLMGSEDTTPQTVSNSQTGAHALASNLQAAGPSYDPNFGKTVGNTLYGGEQGKGGISADNGFHDASTEGGSMFDSWVNGEMYSTDDVPSSSKGPLGMKLDQTQTAPWIAESEGSFKNASRELVNGIIAEGHAYSQPLLSPRKAAERIGAAEPLEASSPKPNASSTNFERASYSIATDLNSDVLAFSTTDISDAPSGFVTIQAGLMFKPDLNSPLHTVRPSELSRRSPIPSNSSQLNLLDIPMKSPMSSIYLQSNLPSPRSENLNFDAISVHTADGEGTDEDDDVIILEYIPSTDPSKKPSHEPDRQDSLFTPPPSAEYVAVEDLFTPPPAKTKRPRPPPKVFMSHVSLPPPRHQHKTARIPLPPPPKKKPRPAAPVQVHADRPTRKVSSPPPRHQPTSAQISRPPPPKKKVQPAPHVQVHNDLARAMQASWDNNESLGTLPLHDKVIKVNRAKANPKEPKYPGKAPVPGPSRYSSESTSVSRDVGQSKRRRNAFEEREESGSVSSKRARVTIDLTFSDDVSETRKRKREEVVARPKPRPKLKPKTIPKQLPPPPAAPTPTPVPNSGGIQAKAPPPLAPARTKYVAEEDRVRLLLGTIRETPPDLVFHNTRFVRRRVLGVAAYLQDTPTWGSSSSERRTRRRVDVNWRSLVPRSKTTTSTSDSEGEKTLGGRLFWAEGVEDDDEEGTGGDDGDGDEGDEGDNEVIIVSKAPLRQDTAPKPSVPPAPPPPRIDLAAQFKKRQRKAQAPPQKAASTAVAASSSPSVASIRPATIQKPAATATSTPSVGSVRPTSTQTHTATPSASASNGHTELAPTPSAKALGKRKAVSPPPPMAGTLVYYPNYSLNQPEGQNSYPNPYYQTLPAQPSLSATSSSSSYPQAPVLIQYYPNLNSGTTSLGAYLYPPQSVPNIVSSEFGPQASGQSASWATHAVTEQPAEYAYATIDPTWLDGQPAAATHQAPEPELELSHDDFFHIPSSPPQQEADPELAADTHSDIFPISPISRRPAQLSTRIEDPPESQSDLFQLPPSHLDDQDDDGYEPAATVFQSLRDTEGPRLTDDSRSPSVPVFKLPPRRGRGRRRSSTSEYASSSPSSDDDNDYSGSEVVIVKKRKPRSAASTSQTSAQKKLATTSAPLFTTLTRADQVEYPLAEFAEYCHQCRRKTFYSKMVCRCKTMICCRCVALRYPDKTFDLNVKQKTCPRCDNYCNCTQCCQKRGVPYVSSTRGHQAQQQQQQQQQHVGPAPTSKRLPGVLLSDAPPPNARYWGAIYSLDGQKIGASFTSSAVDGRPSVPFTSSMARPRPAVPKRTFVGSVQSSWGFGRDRVIKELNPVRQRKSKPRKGAFLVTRFFVGSASFLRYRPRFLTPDALDEEDLLAGLSPLTSLSDSEDDHDNVNIGISILAPPEEAFTPGCLEERDVARAIAAAFEALGFPFVFELP